MKKQVVYLAGLISTDYPESLVWRTRVQQQLQDAGFEVRNPLRGKPTGLGSTDGGITTSIASSRSLLLRDRKDVRESDIILAHLELFGSPRPLIGTIAELAWASDEKKTVVAIAKKENKLMRSHPFISEFVTEYVETEDEAVDFIIKYYWL